MRTPRALRSLTGLVSLVLVPWTGACSSRDDAAVSVRTDRAPIVLAQAGTTATDTIPARAATATANVQRSELGRAIALMDTDPPASAAALETLEDSLPYLQDVLLYYASAARARFDKTAARQSLERFLSEHSGSVLAPEAVEMLAEILEERRETAAALDLADRHGRSGKADRGAARACLAAGRMLAATQPKDAVSYLECARSRAPLSSIGRHAYQTLDAVREKNPELRPTGEAAMMAEARQLGREGRSEEQARTIQELLASYPATTHHTEAVLAYARTVVATKGKLAAAQYLDGRVEEAASDKARARLLYEAATYRWNDNHDADARVGFERMLALGTGIPEEQQALYAIARIDDAAGRGAQAIDNYGKAAARARGATRAESLWRQGWVAYRAKDWAAAERFYRAMADSAAPGSEDDGRAEALYWGARSLEGLGRREDAMANYELLLEEFPLGYYASLAEKRLGRRVTLMPVTMPKESTADSLPSPAGTALARMQALRQAGLESLAARDLQASLTKFDGKTRASLLPSLQRVGAFDTALQIAVELHKKGEISRDQARPYLYPRAHAEIVEQEARRAGIDPVMVYALMRQESAFAPQAVSSANALGLMQLLETTATRVANKRGITPPQRSDLFEPAVNIRLGVAYLAELSKQFEGNPPLILAAYNAGENAAQRWQSLVAAWDEDEMIEQISYRETRAYVKSVLRNMRNYRRLYPDVSAGLARSGRR
ncbi:MAG TPA: lytic transglycosylase domain-containing protein [Candidatus Binatia bacterium]|nr:lytic transglycosylase domain-containing protein [Candidatus Binatia bacterium]